MSTAVRKTYIPYMCDHALALEAALQALGVPAETLPPSDEETLAMGRELCLGRECLPLFVATGDILRRARQPDFDPARATYFMPTTCGPCRFGQYRTMLRLLLDEAGLDEMAIVSPNAANGYQGMSDQPQRFRRLAWQGIVAVDLLLKLRYEHRPSERHAGETDRLYWACLNKLVAAIRAGGGRRAVRAMAWAGVQFAALDVDQEVDRGQRRPWIGILGEIYLRANTFTNQDLARQVEQLGGRVWVAPMLEWFYFSVWGAQAHARRARRPGAWVRSRLVQSVQRYDEERLLRPVRERLTYAHEPPIEAMMEDARTYYEPLLGSEAALSVGKAVDFARHGLSGVINVLPFSCMPGLIVTGLAEAIRADHAHLPWLDVTYDAQGGTNLQTRLEAFMFQARQYQKQREAKE
jgi:predicted nucleotide-binding protein (sugar kinase/HSP70/actin superfamily)